ncbi:MAG: hypothetical protein JJE23_07160 [Thermoleophilia bacterium]|jgi:hypothetical protein|nr:hypothetical protein [Thermoleophilia bacterium]
MHGIYVGDDDPEPKQTATPNFDGGVRADPNAMPIDPRRRPYVYREPGGWPAMEIEDGAELLFPFLRGESRQTP